MIAPGRPAGGDGPVRRRCPSARSSTQGGPDGLPAHLVFRDQCQLAGERLVERARLQPPQQVGAELGPTAAAGWLPVQRLAAARWLAGPVAIAPAGPRSERPYTMDVHQRTPGSGQLEDARCGRTLFPCTNDRTFNGLRPGPWVRKGRDHARSAPIDTPSLGDRSYLAHDGELRPGVDPQRDIDRITALAARARRADHPRRRDAHAQRLRHGGLALPGPRGQLPGQRRPTRSGFARTPVSDGDDASTIGDAYPAAGAGDARAYLHPPVLRAGSEGEVAGVFTGGSLLFGSTGRTDLLGAGAHR